jgi:NIMA (never in mitosis gene a)-related kinase
MAKKSKTMIPEGYIWKVALQLLFGIKALHAMKIFHRDIKPANILLTKNE